MHARDLDGKVGVVTGGGRWIGRSIARGLAAAGADVALCARSADQVGAVAVDLRAQARRALHASVDVTDRTAVDAFAARVVAELGQVDVLVNNAGGSFGGGLVSESAPEDWTRTIEVNLLGTYLVTRAFLPHLNVGAKIINIGSGMGHQAGAGNSAYRAAKAGVRMFTQSLAMEVFERGIDVNEVVPGPVATTAVSWATDRSSEEAVLREFEHKPPPFSPSERVKHPDEVAELVVTLARMRAGGPTGQTFSLARRPI